MTSIPQMPTHPTRAIWILFIWLFYNESSCGQAMLHPGILNSKPELEFLKNMVRSNQPPWKQAFEVLKSSKYSSLTYTPHPFKDVCCGSYNKPNIGCNEMVEDGMAAYSLSLMWYLTDDRRYANKAIEIINAWAFTYQTNSQSNSRLVVSWAVPWYVNAAEILRYTPSGWKLAEIQDFSNLLTEKLLPYTTDDTMPGNDWVLSSIEAHMAIAIFTDNRLLFDRAVERWRFRVKTYIYETSDGPVPIASPGKTRQQMTGIWRNTSPGTVYVNGLGMETCRDLGHLMLGFRSLMYSGEYAWHQGVDVFAPEQKRIRDFLELHAGWIIGAQTVPKNISGGKLLLKPGSPMVPGETKSYDLEIAYNHIGKRLGNSLPATSRMLAQSRPESAHLWVTKWECLTHADLPLFAVQTVGSKLPDKREN